MSTVMRDVYVPGPRFVSRVENGTDGEVVSMPFDDAIASLSSTAADKCQLGPERWIGAVLEEGGRAGQMFGINNFTNVDCEPNPFKQRGVMWNKINVASLGPFSLELWKCESDDRLFARIGFAVQFPVFFQRICMITPENVKEVVARELRIIAMEMYNPKLDRIPKRGDDQAEEAERKRRREAPDYDPSKEYTGPPLRSTRNEPNPDIAMNEGAALKRAKSA